MLSRAILGSPAVAAGAYSPLTKSALPTTIYPGPIPDPQEYIAFPHEPHLSRTKVQPFSAGVWLRAADAGAFYPVFNKMSAAPFNGWLIELTAGANFNATIRGDAHSNDYISRGLNGPFNTGLWYLLGFSYDGSNTIGGLLTYRNGVAAFSAITGSTVAGTIVNTNDVVLSYQDAGWWGDWPYNLCHCFYVDRVITPAEWAAIYGPGVPQFLSPILGSNILLWSTLGDGCAIGPGNVIDLSSYANHGTAVNMEASDFVATVPP